MLKSFFVPDNFDGDLLVGHVVQGSDNLSETTFADDFEDFVTVADVIVKNLQTKKLKWNHLA